MTFPPYLCRHPRDTRCDPVNAHYPRQRSHWSVHCAFACIVLLIALVVVVVAAVVWWSHGLGGHHHDTHDDSHDASPPPPPHCPPHKPCRPCPSCPPPDPYGAPPPPHCPPQKPCPSCPPPDPYGAPPPPHGPPKPKPCKFACGCSKPKAHEVRHINGSNSHPEHLGATSTPLRRYVKTSGGGDCGHHRPGPRHISDVVCKQSATLVPSTCGLSHMAMVWGQFVDHTFTLVETNASAVVAIQGAQDIASSVFRVDCEGTAQQVNSLSAFIDGSSVYGSDAAHATWLREHSGGRMKTGRYSYGEGLPSQNGRTYVAGDIRAAENSLLAAVHTLFLREHNWWAARLGREHPRWDDEKLYQKCRAIVGAEIQAVTYNEFLPALLGTPLPPACYDPLEDPRIANEFSGAAYRFGHSMVTEELELRQPDSGRPNGAVTLRDAFFVETAQDGVFMSHGPAALLVGAALQSANEIDAQVVSALRDFLFTDTGSTPGEPIDLASMNMARGRDHCLPPYHAVRWAMGKGDVEGWHDVTADEALRHKLAAAYGRDGYKDMDLWLGLLVEDHQDGACVGPTLEAVLTKQFAAVRDGDAHYYEWNAYIDEWKHEIHATSLKDIVLRNFPEVGPHVLHDDAFHVH